MVLSNDQRRKSLGASEAAAALGESPWTSRYALWAEKTGQLPPDNLDDVERVQWGKILEPVIVREFCQRTGRTIHHNFADVPMTHREVPFLTATPDGLQDLSQPARVPPPAGCDGPGVLDAKAVSEWKRHEWEKGKAPLQYQIQLQHQMAVTGFQWGSLAALVGGQRLEWIDLPRDDTFIAAMIEAECQFWDLVQSGTPPRADGSDSCSETLRRLYLERGDGWEVSELPAEADLWDQELVVLKDGLKRLEARKKELENLIKTGIGTASIGALPSGAVYTWRTTVREDPAREARRSEFRVLRRAKKMPRGKVKKGGQS